jgi:hypothetical protein
MIRRVSAVATTIAGDADTRRKPDMSVVSTGGFRAARAVCLRGRAAKCRAVVGTRLAGEDAISVEDDALSLEAAGSLEDAVSFGEEP